MGIPPIKMTSLYFEFARHPEIAYIDGSVTEKHFISLSQDGNHCSDDPDGNLGFQECSKNFFRDALISVSNRTIPGSYSTNRSFNNLYKFSRIVG